MNGKLAEDKSEDTDCDGSSLPEDFSEVGWQEAGRLFQFIIFLIGLELVEITLHGF